MNTSIIESIVNGNVHLGIEFGSTRIKVMLISDEHDPIAQGTYDWTNQFENGFWTYHLNEVWHGLQESYRNLLKDVEVKFGVTIVKLSSIGISAMMHGYLVFDKHDQQLVPFRTWRNTCTEQASHQLSEIFNFNIPQRWSIAHLYQSILNKETHVKDISYLTTLAGYVHWQLTGSKVVGIGEASGIFPVENMTLNYNAIMLKQFDELLNSNQFEWSLKDILPSVLVAGENAGTLSVEGSKLLDSSGKLCAGVMMCPPEGDAGTGMVSTNCITARTGNISAGTSVFAMIVLENELKMRHTEIDIVSTPEGRPVAMVHSNTCTSDIDAWLSVFNEAIESFGYKVDKSNLYQRLFLKALEGDEDSGGLLSYNYLAGEPVTGFVEGRPLIVRLPDGNFNLANVMRSLLFSSLSTLRIGIDILYEKEDVKIDRLLGHGGFFKTKDIGQKFMASVLEIPTSVMSTAAEGGSWGIAILAAYMKNKNANETLEMYLNDKVFKNHLALSVEPDTKLTLSFKKYLERYIEGLPIEQAAVESIGNA